MRTGTADNDVLSETDPDKGRRGILIDIIGINGSLSVATDLMTSDRPTVTRPEPDWPMSDERLPLLIGLGVAAAIAVLLGLRRLARWLLQRSAR